MAAILMHVPAGGPNAHTNALKSILQGDGHTVTEQTWGVAPNFTGIDLGLIGSNGGATVNKADEWAAAPCPVLLTNYARFSDFLFCTIDAASSQTDLEPTAAMESHPIGAILGYTEAVDETIYSSSGSMGFATAGLTGSATSLAIRAVGGAEVLMFEIPAGFLSRNSTNLAEKWIGLGIEAANLLNADGEALLLATVDYLLGELPFEVTIDADIEIDSTFILSVERDPVVPGGDPASAPAMLSAQAAQGIRFNGRDLGDFGYLATFIEGWADVPEEARAAAERIGLDGLLASSNAGTPSRDIPLAITIPDIGIDERDDAVGVLVDILGGRQELTFEHVAGKKLLATLQGMSVAAEVAGLEWTFGDVVCLARLLAAQPQPIEDVATVTALPGAVSVGTAPHYGVIHVVNDTGSNAPPFHIIYRDFRGNELARLTLDLALSISTTLYVDLATQEVRRHGTMSYSDFQIVAGQYMTGDWFRFDPRHANLATGDFATLTIEKDDGTEVPGYLIHRRRWE